MSREQGISNIEVEMFNDQLFHRVLRTMFNEKYNQEERTINKEEEQMTKDELITNKPIN